jgi:hypothetical protein
MPTQVLARMAASGIYLLRGIPRDLQRGARARAVRDETTLRRVLLQALDEYAAGTWRPRPDVLMLAKYSDVFPLVRTCHPIMRGSVRAGGVRGDTGV